MYSIVLWSTPLSPIPQIAKTAIFKKRCKCRTPLLRTRYEVKGENSLAAETKEWTTPRSGMLFPYCCLEGSILDYLGLYSDARLCTSVTECVSSQHVMLYILYSPVCYSFQSYSSMPSSSFLHLGASVLVCSQAWSEMMNALNLLAIDGAPSNESMKDCRTYLGKVCVTKWCES